MLSIGLEDKSKYFKCLNPEITDMSVTLDSLNVNFSKFVIYSKPAISFIPSPEYMDNVLICNKSSFVIGSFIFFLSKLYLLICCCNFLSTITFALSSC